MTRVSRIDQEAAQALFLRFAPLISRLEERGIDYCLVGGLAVLAHCLVNDVDQLRATQDADLMVPRDYSNGEFAQDYLRVYATEPSAAQAVYDALLGDSEFSSLTEGEAAFMNVSFVGADEDLDGVDTPDFDVCRVLNARSINTINRQRLHVCGIDVWVATADELLGMKRDTIAMLGAGFQESSRPQDFLDVAVLERIVASESEDEPRGGLGARLRGLLGGR